MVKVLENKIVDLDLLPGQAQIDLQRQLRTQLGTANSAIDSSSGAIPSGDGQEGSESLASQALQAGGTKNADGSVQLPKELLPDNMSEEDKKKAKGIAGTILDGSGNVIGGLAGTVGGVLKGVGDTTGNTVYALGSGLAQTGTGAVSGLADTAKAAGGVKTGPRKIEVRNQKQEEDVKEKLGDKKDEVEVENVGEKGGKKVEKGKSS